MQLFLLIGQSNMAGRGVVEPQDQVTNPHIFMLTQYYEWLLAKDPVHFDRPALIGVGLCSEFARTLVKDDPKITVGLIPCAVGGTSLGEWKPGGELYTNAIVRAREAMKNGNLVGILWHQGESDIPGNPETYNERFAAMIQQLRSDLHAENVPVIVGELGHYLTQPNAAKLRTVLSELPKSLPICGFVSSEGLTPKVDNLHFDAPSLRTFGARYAAVWIEMTHKATRPLVGR
ncbi:MAG: sialate O-acetylesterase [Verrucomicrobiae bacterium]